MESKKFTALLLFLSICENTTVKKNIIFYIISTHFNALVPVIDKLTNAFREESVWLVTQPFMHCFTEETLQPSDASFE